MQPLPSEPIILDGVCDLKDWGVIVAEGADAASFLHGQLTQDVQHLEPGRARTAGYCSAKGRLLASFQMWRTSVAAGAPAGGDASLPIALACSADLLDATLKRLSMFVLRARCKLRDGRGLLRVVGLAGPSGHGWALSTLGLNPDASAPAWAVHHAPMADLIRWPDAAGVARWLLVQPADAPLPSLPALPEHAWAWLEVQGGIARVTAATADHFVPQMVNLELTGGVNFQKGCYPGQEVVARSQYRGTLKRRMALMASTEAVHPGQEVFHDSDPGQPAGEVVLSAPGTVAAPAGSPMLSRAASHVGAPADSLANSPADSPADSPSRSADDPTPCLALVSLKVDLLASEGQLRAGSAVLLPHPLPYELPSQPA